MCLLLVDPPRTRRRLSLTYKKERMQCAYCSWIHPELAGHCPFCRDGTIEIWMPTDSTESKQTILERRLVNLLSDFFRLGDDPSNTKTYLKLLNEILTFNHEYHLNLESALLRLLKLEEEDQKQRGKNS